MSLKWHEYGRHHIYVKKFAWMWMPSGGQFLNLPASHIFDQQHHCDVRTGGVIRGEYTNVKTRGCSETIVEVK